jgi:hypothetical protein
VRRLLRLDPHFSPGPVHLRQALLVNPFYAKDLHAGFGSTS